MVPTELTEDIVYGVRDAWETSVRNEAASYLPKTAGAVATKLPVINDLLALKGNPDAGKIIYNNKCILCHQINNQGGDFGPALTEIGSKYPPEGLLNAIVNPSAGISFGYEGWELKMKDGSVLTGIISSKTKTDLDLKFPGGSTKHIKTTDISEKKKLSQSLMTEKLYENMSDQDLANLLAWLSGLKKKM